MQKFKRVFALLVAVMTVITSIPSMAFAEAVAPDWGNDDISKVETANEKFTVLWNDNHNQNDKKARPSIADFSAGAKLSFVLDGEEYELNEETMAYIGMTELPEIMYQETGEVSKWASNLELPKVVYIKTEVQPEDPEDPENPDPENPDPENPDPENPDPENPDPVDPPEPPEPVYEDVPHQITWKMALTVDEDDYITDKNDGHDAKFTVTSAYIAKIKWHDNENLYESRPALADNKADIYRYTTSKSSATKVAGAEAILEEALNDEEVILTLDKLPAYDADGRPYYYFIDMGTEDIDAKNDAGRYDAEYTNIDTNEESELFDGGYIDRTLRDERDVAVNKVWKDGNNTARPNCTVYLYRIAEDAKDGVGTITSDQIERAGPVQGFDNAAVPKTDADGKPIADNEPVVIELGDVDGVLSLPKYDLVGKKYVYFFRERGLVGDYKSTIDNTTSEYGDEVISIADKEGILLAGGTIINERTGVIPTSATKTFVSKSMQQAKAAVKFALQVKDGSGWRDATEDDFAKGYTLSSNPKLSKDEDGRILLEIDDFIAEERGKTVSGPTLEKYADDGSVVQYRWYEAAVGVNGQWFERGPVDPYADKLEYELGNFGEIAPGVDNDGTTALVETNQDSKTEITNRLVGETQIKIVKKWQKEDGSPDPDPAADGATFEIWRQDLPNPIDTVVVGKEDEVEPGTWVETYTGKDGHLPRYDEEGREYVYLAKEVPMPGWTQDFDVTKAVVEDEDGYFVPELQYVYVNRPGPGQAIRFDVEKTWLDESDLVSRTPVKIEVYRLPDNKRNELVKVDPGVTLSNSNDWYKRFWIQPVVAGDTKDNYIIVEEDINGVPVNYSAPNNMNPYVYIQQIQDSNPEAEDYPDALIVGNVKEPGQYDKIDYEYDVFISRASTASKYEAGYTITNRRKALLSLHMEKVWLAGGQVPQAGFEVSRYTQDTKKEVIGTFAMPDGEATQELEGKAVIEMTGETKCKIDITDLPKYDERGREYFYVINEVWLGTSDNKFVDKKAQVAGDTYVSSVFQDSKAIAGRVDHHSGDEYYWKASNTRSDSYSLNSYKLWRDDGAKSEKATRPDVYFDLYRVSITDAEYDNFETAMDISKFCNEQLEDGRAIKIKGERIWNTKYNEWVWSCDLGSYPRYDGNGNRYIYFITEGYSGDSGSYKTIYLNDNSEDNPEKYIPSTSSKVKSTVEALDTPKDAPVFTEDVTVLADGYNKGEKGYGDYYSRTVANYREKYRTLTGRKIWMLPKGYELPDKDLPEIEVDVYRSVEKIDDETLNSYEKMTAKIAEMKEAGTIEFVGSRDLKSPNWAFSFDVDDEGKRLPRYDQYGRTLNYYMYEAIDLEQYDFEIEKVSAIGFNIVNTYDFDGPSVKIDLAKTWKSSVTDRSITDMAPALFTLYAVQCDEDGNPVKGDNGKQLDSIKLATKVLQPGETSYTFDKITETTQGTGIQGKGKDIPLKGPNGYPMKFYVTEANLNGTTHTHPDNVGGYSATNPMEVTPGDSATLYTGDVSFDNDYTGGQKELTVSKTWAVTSQTGDPYNNAQYIPEKITFKIKRKCDAVTVNGKYHDKEDEDFTTVVLTAADGWSKKVTDPVSGTTKLVKYSSFGKEYTYYVAEEVYEYAKDQGNFTATAKTNNVGYTNTLKRTDISVEKNWAWTRTDKAMTQADFNTICDLGSLPQNIKFTVQRKSGEGSFEDMKDKTGATVEVTVPIKQSWNYTKKWTDLPQNDPDGNAYTYRIKETLGSIVYYSDATAPYSGEKTGSDAGSALENATVTWNSSNRTAKFKNEIKMHEFKLRKLWIDEHNRDNTRPDTLTITINGVDYTMTKDNDQSGDYWNCDTPIYLPDVDGGKYEDVYDKLVSEELIPDGYMYIGNDWTTDEDTDVTTITTKNQFDIEAYGRVCMTIDGNKIFSGDYGGDRDWKELRPEVRLQLQYKDRDTKEWVDITDDNKEIVGLYEDVDAIQTVVIGDKTNSGQVKWEGLYKFWTETYTEGDAEPIDYKLIEKCYVNGQLVGQAAYDLIDDDAVIEGKIEDVFDDEGNFNLFEEEATLENPLKTTQVEADKIWNEDYDDEEGLRIEIVMSLFADGTKVLTKTANDSNNWHVEFKNLPKYNAVGDEIEYTVQESPAPGYTGTYVVDESTDNVKKYIFTNTMDLGTITFNKEALINESCSDNALYAAEGTGKLKDVKFGLFDKATGEMVDEQTTDADGNITFVEVRNGNYYVQETYVPAPFILDDTKYYVSVKLGVSSGLFIDEDMTEQLENQTILNDQCRTSIKLIKELEDNPDWIAPGAKYGIYRVVTDEETGDKTYIKIAEKVTDENGELEFEGLITGTTYAIRELENPMGTYLAANEVTFDVVDQEGVAVIENFDGGDGTAEFDGETITITWADPVVVAEINKIDEDGEPLAGAKLQILDGKTVVDKWTSSEEPHVLYATLEAGKTYTLHEAKAPKGYKLAKDVEFTVPDDAYAPGEAEPILVEMVDEKKPDKPDTGDNGNLPLLLTIFGGAVASLLGMKRIRRRAN